MVINSHRTNLNEQIREEYGRVTYTQTTHVKESQYLKEQDIRLKWFSIILSVVISAGILSYFITDIEECTILSAIASIVMLINSSILKEVNYSSRILEHKSAADSLWFIREKYLCLLIDFESLSDDEIIERRNELIKQTNHIYSEVSTTGKRSYKEAKRAIKDEEEQFFSDEELNNMLPPCLRKK